jgi:hypothetical protein
MFRLAFLALLAASIFGAAPAQAQGRLLPRGDVQTLDRILPGIASRYPGTFYDAQGPYTEADGTLHYRLKWMTPEGRIVWLDTDARTGRVFSVQQTSPRPNPYYGAPPPYAPPPYAPPPYLAGPGFRGYGYPRNVYPGRYYGVPRGGRWNGRNGPNRYWNGPYNNGHHGG